MTEKRKPTSTPIDTPIEVGNPAAASAMGIDQSHIEEFANVEESAVVTCRKPPKGIFFTTIAEVEKPWNNRRFYFVLELEGHDPYVVAPLVVKQRAEEDVIRPILIVRAVTMAGEEFLWPLKLDLNDQRSNAYNKSAQKVLEVADGGSWVRLISAKGHYNHQVSKKTLEQVPPKFSNRTFDQLVDDAFKDRVISSLDHEIWNLLDHGSEK